MMSVLKRWMTSLPPEAQAPQSEWFEIWLFKTKLRFQMPPPTSPAREPVFSGIDSNPDLRPYVNTESRQLYDRKEQLGYYSIGIYTAGWLFGRQGLWGRAHSELRLQLMAYAVTDTDHRYYPDILQDEIALEWLNHHYHERNTYHLFRHDNKKMELLGSSSEKTPEPLTIRFKKEGPLSVFKVQPDPSLITYWIPFSQRDFLRFDFKLLTLSDVDNTVKEQTLEQANNISKKIISSAELLYDPSISKLSFLHLTDQ